MTYRTDADGWRVTPKPSKPAAPEIVILGCSFTWGIGVEDTETYPWILGTEAWPDHRIRTSHAPLGERFKWWWRSIDCWSPA